LSEEKKSAFIFPAFAHDYPDDPFSGLKDFENIFHCFLKQAARDVDEDLIIFNSVSKNFLEDEVRTQYITYIYSCALSENFKRNGISPCFTAGYSMGIYSSLFHSGVISFIDGLLLIRSAYHAIKKVTGDGKFGMCSVIGLSREDISDVIQSQVLEVGITNQNSQYAFVLSGTLKDIVVLTDLVIAEGALHTHLLKVMLPYHSTILNETKEIFIEFIKSIHFNNPSTKIISLIDQRIINDPEDLKIEVINNLFTPLNWYKTQLELQRMGLNLFIECGFGNGLVKNAKFIEGNYKFYSAANYLRNLNTE
jgi:[acyl-carrier-protein] S-malonyltransferase